MFNYLINDNVTFNCGFNLTVENVTYAINQTNEALLQLPVSLLEVLITKQQVL